MSNKSPSNSAHPKTRAEWRAWLAEHHQREEGVWLVTYKKGTGKPRIDYGEAVEEALCFGWVDSRPAKLDDERSMLYFAPRKPGTGWSKHNKRRVEKLIAAGLMVPAGLAKVESTKRDGSWSRLDAVEALKMPEDLEQALAAYPNAKRYFEAFPRSVKRGILEWIANAKKPETRMPAPGPAPPRVGVPPTTCAHPRSAKRCRCAARVLVLPLTVRSLLVVMRPCVWWCGAWHCMRSL